MDQELGRSAFTVERLTYTRTAEGTTSRSVTHQAMGCVHPGTPEMIQLLPEEERLYRLRLIPGNGSRFYLHRPGPDLLERGDLACCPCS